MSVSINGVEQAPAFKKFESSTPAPGPEWEGVTVTHREEGKTDVLLCLQNSVGAYEWIKVGEST